MRILAKRLQPDSVFGRKPRSGIDRPSGLFEFLLDPVNVGKRLADFRS